MEHSGHQLPPVAAAIRAAMQDAGLSQRALADQTGIPLVTLNRGLRDERRLNLDQLDRIATALGRSVAALLTEAA